MSHLTPYQQRAPALGEPTAMRKELHEFISFWAAIRRRARLFTFIAGGFALLVALATVLTPKTYTTTARLMAGNPATGGAQAGNTNLPILNALVLDNGAQSAETFAALAQQDDVAASVVSALKLPTSPHALLSHVAVKPVVNTALLELSVTWRNPNQSAVIANRFADAFIWREREFVRSEASAAIGFISTELPKAEENMQSTARAVADFQATNGFVDASAHTQDVVGRASSIETKIETLALDSREAGALLANAQAQLATLPPTIDTAKQITVNPVVSDLQNKLESTEVQLANARQQYTDRHPMVVSLVKQRDALLAQLRTEPAQVNSGNTLAPNPVYQSLQQQAAQYQQRIQGDEAQLAMLQRQKSAMVPALRTLPALSMQLATLQQRAKLASDVYNALEQKYSDATIARSTAISDISVIQRAMPDSATVRPNLVVNLMVAIVVGLLLACVVVFVLDMVERPVRATGDGEMLGLPVVARIPEFTTTNPRMLPWLQSMTVEAFLQLCVTLRLKIRHPLRSLAITSPCRGDGKSTIAFNLAKAMATLQQRVLLIDGDMRRPTLHEHAQRENRSGLGDVLAGHMSLAECLQPLSSNLDLLASGLSVENPVSLLQGGAFEQMLKGAAERYQIVIIDTPPLASVSDGLIISSLVDGIAFVVAENTTDERLAKRVVTQMQAVGIENVLGIVLNRDTQRISDYADYFTCSSGERALPGSVS